MSKVGIVVPIYHSKPLHKEFTDEMLSSVYSSDNEVRCYLVVNYSREDLYPREGRIGKLEVVVIDNPKKNNVAAAWNLGIKRGITDGNDYVVVANNDIILHRQAIDNLVRFAQEHSEYILWTASEWDDYRSIRALKVDDLEDSFDEHPHFSCFMVTGSTITKLKVKEEGTQEPYPGYFDENFEPAYFEDQDMVHRIYRLGFRAVKVNRAKFYHYGSRTIKVDDELHIKNKRTYERAREYFKKKWGYDPHGYVPIREEDRLVKSYSKPFGV